jgi:ABC-type multidrug transport system fused ATPase/permease subunit
MYKNPVFLLVCKGWQHAHGYRARIIFYVFLFSLAILMELAEPYAIGRLLNDLQRGLSQHSSLLMLLNRVGQFAVLLFGITVFYWMFHLPGRVIEKNVAYHIRNRYKAAMFQKITELPLRWHRDHHSGESIDKINRASTALYNFFEEGFVLIYMVTRLVGIVLIVYSFMPLAGWCALIASILAGLNIAVFDHFLTKKYDYLNKADHHTASAFHDYMTNIVSVLTLRLESRTRKELETRLGKPLPVYQSEAKVNEWKWAITGLTISAMTSIAVYSYAHTTTAHGAPLLVGTLITLFEYLRRLGQSFYDFAMYSSDKRRTFDLLIRSKCRMRACFRNYPPRVTTTGARLKCAI